MKAIISKYTGTNLILRIVIGLAIGILLALIIPYALTFVPQDSPGAGILSFLGGFISAFGTLFVGALKGIAPLLVFFLVSTALSGAKVGSGGSMKMVIALYLIGTVFAAFLATVVSQLFPVNLIFASNVDTSSYTAPSGLDAVITTLLGNIVANPIASLSNANYLGILFWAILFGIALRTFVTEGILCGFRAVTNALTQVVRWIIQLAPFGIMGLIYNAVSSSGLAIFTDYAMLLALLITSMLAMFLIVNPLIVFLVIRQNPYPLVFKCIARSAVTAFFTRSSAANIPVNMDLCKEMELDEDQYSISIPLGATINMEGAAITISVMTLAACHTLGIQIDPITAFLLSILSALGACGASGVTGGSLLLIPMACSLFGISNDIAMSVVGVGFIIGVIQDSLETALNSSTDVLFTAAAQIAQRKKEGRELPKI